MGIINRNGALFLATGVDNSGLYSGLRQAEGRIDLFGNHISSVGDKITKLTGIGFGIAGLKAFGQEIINVTGELQMLESSFEVLLGGKGVSAFMSELKKFAVDSPLSLSNVGDSAQMLLAFGVEAENVMSVVKQLGDISMGNSAKFQSLALAYSQMTSAGKVLSQDLRQMATAGFNPLGEIANKTGKTIQEVTQMMDDGQITVQQVAEAFRSATAEGGKFHGMTEKQAEGFKGLQAQLEGGIQDALNDIGKSQENLISGGYKAAITLVENYDKIGEALTALIATYGLYKTAIIVTNAVSTAQYAAETVGLAKLLPAKAASINSDIEAAVASGRLSQIKGEQLIAIRAEIAAKLDGLKANHAIALSELNAAQAAHKSALQRSLAAKQAVVAKQQELVLAVSSGNAAQAEAAKKSLLSAQDERSIAVKARKSTAIQLEIASSRVNAASTAVETMQTNINTTSQIANTRSSRILAAAKYHLSAASKALGLSMLANPYILAAAGVVALTYAIYKVSTAQTEWQKRQKDLNDSVRDFNKETATEQAEIDRLFGKLDSLKKGTKEYDEAKQSIINKYGPYLKGLGDEKIALENVEQAYKAISIAAKQAAIDRAIASQSDKAAETWASQQSKIVDDLEYAIRDSDKYRGKKGKDREITAITETIKRELKENGKLTSETQKLVDGFADKVYNTHRGKENYVQNAINNLYKNDTEYQKAVLDVTKKLGVASNDYLQYGTQEIQQNIATINEALKRVQNSDKTIKFKLHDGSVSSAMSEVELKLEKQKALDALATKNQNKNSIPSLNNQIIATKKNISDLKNELNDLQKGITPKNLKSGEQFDFAKGIEEKSKALNEAQNKLSYLLTGKSHSATNKDSNQAESAAQKQAEAQRKLDEDDKQRQIDKLKFDFDMRQREIDNLNDSFEKRLKQIKLNYEREDQEIKEFEKKAEKNQLDYSKSQFVKDKGTDKGFEKYYQTFDKNSLPEGLRPTDIAAQTKQMTDAAEKARQRGFDEINLDLMKMLEEQELMFASDLDKKLADLDNYYNEQRIKAGTNAELIAQIEANRKRAITEVVTHDNLDKLDFEEKLAIEKLAGMESIGMTELVEERKLEIEKEFIQKRIALLQPLADGGDKEAQKQIKLLQTSLTNVDIKKPATGLKALADKTLFNIIQKGFEKAIKSSGKYGDSLEDNNKISEEAQQKTTALFNKFSKEGAQVGEVVGMMQSAFGGMDDGLDQAMEAVGNIAQGFASGGPMGAAMAAIGEGIKLIGKANEAAARHEKALEEIANSRIAQQRQYNLLLLEQNLLLEEAMSIFGEKQITKASNSIDVYRDSLGLLDKEIKGTFIANYQLLDELQKKAETNNGSFLGGIYKGIANDYKKQVEAYEKGIHGLYSQKIVTGHEKTGLFGWGKGKDTYSSILDVYKYEELFDKEGKLRKARLQTIIDNEKMSDQTKDYLKNLIALQDQAEASQEALRDYLEATFGSLGTDIMTSLENAIKDRGVNAWEAFGEAGAKVIENLGKQIAYELFFAEKFKELQGQLEEVYGSGKDKDVIAREAMDLVGSFYENIGTQMETAQGFMENWQKEADKYGFEVYKPEKNSQSSSRGGFETMTQDQAGELNGRFTGLLESGLRTEGLIMLMQGDITKMREYNLIAADSILEIKDTMRYSLDCLESISKSNNELYEINEGIKAIKKNTEGLLR